MKRILVVTVVSLAILCALGTLLVLGVSQRSNMSISSLPLYPGATNVRATNVPPNTNTQVMVSYTFTMSFGITGTATTMPAGSQPVMVGMPPSGSQPTTQALTFETPDTPQSVHDYYAGLFPAPTWNSFGRVADGIAIYMSHDLPAFDQVQVYWEPSTLAPIVEIPHHNYTVQVHTRRTGQTTEVWLVLDDWVR
jgi:hypothetical protein